MKVSLADLLPHSHVIWLETHSKNEALGQLLGTLSTSRFVRDADALRHAIFSREVLMSTGVGYGVAVPHAKIPAVDSFVLAVGIARDGIQYGSEIDDDPVRLIVMIAGPDRDQEGYLKLLSTLMKFLKSEKGKILSSTSSEEVQRLGRSYVFELPDSSTPPA
ncbi:MAG TPA: PTS sugar transporter subunit IIA [Planctomycetota bacterium]|jgi:mannitol/fructose-specific phosphotransferase system IIA component (Ntr-type)|nr:PTS sugar transporter subunit IIA [Planctomycetota bacterium]